MTGPDSDGFLDRRRYLRWITGGAAMLAGCNQSPEDGTEVSPTKTDTPPTPSKPSETPTPSPNPADIEVSALSIEPNPAKQTRPFEVSITAVNRGGRKGSKEIAVALDGVPVKFLTFELESQSEGTSTIKLTTPMVGSHRITAGSVSSAFDVKRYPEHFVEREGNQYAIDGRSYYFHGTTDYSGLSPKRNRDRANHIIRDTLSMGMNVIRTSAFGNGDPEKYGGEVNYQPQPGVYNEAAFKRLDWWLYTLKKHDLRAIVNFLEFGHAGIPPYIEWSSTAEERLDFWSDEEANRIFRNYVEYVLTRTNTITGVEYRNDPTILMWEMCNELQNARDPSGEVLQSWIRETSKFMKETDPNHMISTGSSGWYAEEMPWYETAAWRGDGRFRFVEDHKIEGVDTSTFAFYRYQMANPERSVKCHPEEDEECSLLITKHVEDSHKKIKKPVYLNEFNVAIDREEFGVPISSDNDRGQRQLKRRNELLKLWYATLDTIDANGAILASLDWPRRPTNPFGVYVPEDESTAPIVKAYSKSIHEKSGAKV